MASQSLSAAPPLPTAEAAEAARLAAGYSRLQRTLELVGVTLWFGLCALLLGEIGTTAAALPRSAAALAGAFALAALGGLLFADFASGVVHWAADNWGSADWPVLGSAFIRPFRLHHLDAEDITRHTWLELNGNNCLVSLPLFGCAHLALDGSLASVWHASFWVATAAWVLGTNQFHAWAHTPAPGPVVRALQASGLVLSRAHHDHHHARPHDRNYCITNGWFNAPLRAIRFFEGLEWAITRVSGAEAHHHRLARGEPLI